jgi:prephenate dehydrogenase
MPYWDRVAIIGVGLIGGSIGLGLRQRNLARHIIGIGRRMETLRTAENRGAITEATTDLAAGVAQAELVIIGTPVQTIVDQVKQVAEAAKSGTLVTDVGSTKQSIVEGADRALAGALGLWTSFVGSHPLAGSERTGVEFARADLLEGRTVVVTPSEASKSDAVERVESLWQALGAKVVRMSAAEHDQAVAATSHVPHVVAAALAAATKQDYLPLTATGWADTTRVAAGDVELWRQILSDNRPHVLAQLREFEKFIAAYAAALERGDEAQLAHLLQQGKRHRDAVGS